MKGLLRLIAIAGVIFLAALALLFTWRMRPENAIVVAPGGEIRYDDFAFSVDGVRRAKALGEDGAQIEAQGEFVVVTLGVHNHAKRVDFTFRPEIVRLVVDGGAQGDANSDAQDSAEYTAAPAALPALAAANGCTRPIAAGSSCTTELAFDVPAGTRGLRIRLQFSGLFFDAIDTLVNGRTSLALPDQQR